MRCNIHNADAGHVYALRRCISVASPDILPVVRATAESEAPIARMREDNEEPDAQGLAIRAWPVSEVFGEAEGERVTLREVYET